MCVCVCMYVCMCVSCVWGNVCMYVCMQACMYVSQMHVNTENVFLSECHCHYQVIMVSTYPDSHRSPRGHPSTLRERQQGCIDESVRNVKC